MKTLVLFGTRPEIIRLSRIIPKLDKVCHTVLVNTRQNFHSKLNDIFLSDLEIRQPNYVLSAVGSFGKQISSILVDLEEIIKIERPNKLLVLGDTNSGLGAIVAQKMGVSVYHMEAGNRSFDNRVPEETNRRLIDHISDVLMPYTHRSAANLLAEGIPANRIYVIGNPINEVLLYNEHRIETSNILDRLLLEPKKYFLATIHRAENVDILDKIHHIIDAFGQIYKKYHMPVIVSTHPRTRGMIDSIESNIDGIKWMEPFNLFDFIKLEKNAACVLSDSGTVCEEASIYQIPNVHVRDVTERAETVDCGSNIIAGTYTDNIISCVDWALARSNAWSPPEEYTRTNVSDTVINILLSHIH